MSEQLRSPDSQTMYLKEMYKAADNELRVNLIAFNGTIDIALATFDPQEEDEIKTPEEKERIGKQINTLFEKMRVTIENVIGLLEQTAPDRKYVIAQNKTIPEEISSQIRSMERFIESIEEVALHLITLKKEEPFEPIREASSKLYDAYTRLEQIIYTIPAESEE